MGRFRNVADESSLLNQMGRFRNVADESSLFSFHRKSFSVKISGLVLGGVVGNTQVHAVGNMA